MLNSIDNRYFQKNKKGISQFETLTAYLGGSAFQTIVDNPVTAYRQLVQQYAKDLNGKIVDPKIARKEVNKVFLKSPISASLSGLGPRLIGVGFKRVPKFGFLLGISYLNGDKNVGLLAATGASIFSAPFINPVRMLEKQQRAYFKQTGQSKSVASILKESHAQNYKPLFRGTIPLMGHSLISATLGLVGQPELQKKIQMYIGEKTTVNSFTANLLASTVISPIYVLFTNPLSRLEVIMQTSSINKKSISVGDAIKEVARDTKEFGLRGMFRGQGIGIFKAIISLSMFHQGRLYLTDYFTDETETYN